MKFFEGHRIINDLCKEFPNVFTRNTLSVRVPPNATYLETYIVLSLSNFQPPYIEKMNDANYPSDFLRYLKEYLLITYNKDITIVYVQ